MKTVSFFIHHTTHQTRYAKIMPTIPNPPSA